MSKKRGTLRKYVSYKVMQTQIQDQLETTVSKFDDLEEFNEHAAFNYLICDLFEGLDESTFRNSDGKDDHGIDFYVADDSSYSIYQYKIPDIDKIVGEAKPKPYGKEPIRELLSGIYMLLDKDGDYNLNGKIVKLRSDYHRDLSIDPENTSLSATVAVFGEFTESAQKLFYAESQKLQKDYGVSLRLVDWSDLAQHLHSADQPQDIEVNIDLPYEKEDLLQRHDYLYVLAHAWDLYKAFEEYEWNLFDWNVRLQIKKSNINRKIVKSLKHSKTRKQFHHFNNGLLITCKSYAVPQSGNLIRIKGGQIINGCQTVSAIKDAYEQLSPREQEDFREQTLVQVKILRTVDPDFIGELVISTNNQNPMNPRNLKSNLQEQKQIQSSFLNLNPAWFYQRKDGEFDSLVASTGKVRWFKQSKFRVSGRKYRMLDNEKLAKSWLAFVGSSDRALRGGIRYFDDAEDKGYYERVFRNSPNELFWERYEKASFKYSDELFDPEPPDVYQYLMAHSVAGYVDSRRISFQKSKRDAINKGVDSGELKVNPESSQVLSTAKEVDEYLFRDFDYRMNTLVNNAREVIIELFSFVLVKRYGPLSGIQCRALLNIESEKTFVEKAIDHEAFEDLDKDQWMPLVYGLLMYALKQFMFDHDAQLKAAPRLKSLLAQRDTITELRTFVEKYINTDREMDAVWKKRGLTFMESLPDLP